jgi:hypothetical protein
VSRAVAPVQEVALTGDGAIGGRGMALTDTAALSALRTEVRVWRVLETAVREPVAVCATASSGGIFNVRIALRQRAPGEARNAIAAAFGCLANVKNVFVVDPDIDVFSHELEDGPKYFADLMAAVGSRDGREVVRELDVLRRQGLVARDPDGHYLIKS